VRRDCRNRSRNRHPAQAEPQGQARLRRRSLPGAQHHHQERNIIERFFNELKQFRRVATRYDKLLVNFMGFVKLAAIAIWLK